jgi:hypothetical protein
MTSRLEMNSVADAALKTAVRFWLSTAVIGCLTTRSSGLGMGEGQ